MIAAVALSESQASPWWRRPGPLLAALALGGYAIFLALYIGTYAAGSDCSGYMNHARLLAAGHFHAAPRVLPGLTPEDEHGMLFVPLGFVPASDGNGMVPTYPAGLPLLVAAAAHVVGWSHAGEVVLVLHSLLGLLLVYALGRAMGLSQRGAVLGATIIAVSPLYLNYSLQMMSDLPALVWTLAAVLAAWRSRERVPWALAAGAAAAMAVLIRPTNVLIFAPVAAALGLSPRRWLLLISAGLPGAVFFSIHSLSLYGHLFTTGYGNFTGSFDRHWILVTAWHYARWLPALFTPVVLLILGLPWLARKEPRKVALLGLWFLVYAAFYATYDCTHQTWWYLRFLLPAIPPLVVGGLLVARDAAAHRYLPLLRTRVFFFALTAIIANSALWNKRLPSLNIGHDNEIYPEAAAWLQAHVPGNAVILSMQMSGTLYYYTDFTFLRWDFCKAGQRARVLSSLHNSHRPLYAALFPFELKDAMEVHFPGLWTRVGRVSGDVEIWRHEPAGTEARPAGAATPIDNPSDFVWRLPIDQSPSIRAAWMVANGLAWILLAGLLWRLIPGNDWRDWVARAGILLSAGAIGSFRFALTDLIALALLAGAMLAAERRRPGWASALLGVAGLGRGAALLALPAVGSAPWTSKSNLRRWIAVVALVALSVAGLCWHLGTAKLIYADFAWPFGSLLTRWADSVTAIFSGQGLGLAWVGFISLFGFTVQIVFFLCHWENKEPWWKLGVFYAVLMCFLNDAAWMGAAGGAARLLLPLTLAFNVLVRRTRASLTWLLLGNLAVAAGLCSLFLPLEAPADMAMIRTAGYAQLNDPNNTWYWVEQSARHARAWSRGSARLDIETWPHCSRPLKASFSLHSLTPRSVIIRQGGQILWSGTVNRDYAPVTFSCQLTEGRAILDLASDEPGVTEGSGSDTRTLAFAIFDPILALP